MKRLIGAAAVAAVLVGTGLAAATAAGRSFPDTITLTGATSAEGIATGIGSSFYAGDLFKGDIYRGDLRSGSESLFVDAPTGRMALGMKVDAPITCSSWRVASRGTRTCTTRGRART